MPITFDTGTINQPDAGSVGLSMVEKIRDVVVAHPAWDLVEEFTPGSGTVRWYVFKCLASQSGLPQDLYVVIGRTLGDGSLRFAICEDYNVSGHIMSFFSICHAYSSTYTFDSLGRYAANTYTLGINPFSSSGITPGSQLWAPSGTSTKYWITVDNDNFTVAFNGASNGWVHLGAFIPITQMPFPIPWQMMGHQNMPGITRNPAAAGVTTYGEALAFTGGEGTGSLSGTNLLGFAGYLRYNDKLQSNQRAVAEIGMTTYPYQLTEIPAHGYVLGKQKRMRYGIQAPVGMAFGDAYVLSNRLWVPYLPSDTRIWDTGVAAS